MRVEVSHSDSSHPHAAPFAYKLGRVVDEVDHFAEGAQLSVEQKVEKLLAMARVEYPEAEGYLHKVTHFHDHSDGTGSWQDTPQAPTGVEAPVTVEAALALGTVGAQGEVA